MKFLSVCSGIEAASVAWTPLDWEAVAFSEIEPFPCAVLAHHYPDVPNWGDMTKYKDWPDVSIDLLCGGTPCQSFSVAGLRKGLDDPRGNLMLTFGAIAAKYRPRWLVWENVPGVLSSNGGRDFGSFLGLLGELGYGFAYRVLDAQYVRVESHPRAVPQRRRRVFVVGCLGDWHRAAAVLFESESLRGYPAPSRQAWKDVAPTLSARTKGGGGQGTDFECGGGLIETLCVATGQAGAEIGAEIGADMSPTLNCNHEVPYVAHALRSEDRTGRGTPLVPVAYALQHAQIGRKDSAGPQGKGWQEGVAFTADSRACSDAVVTAYRTAGDGAVYEEGDATAPLTTGTDQSANIVAGALCSHSFSGGAGGRPEGAAAGHFLPVGAPGQEFAVRRLTPLETERLQGFPDGYTAIPYRNKPVAADGPRYKSHGNSWAVNVATWVGTRIQAVEALESAL